MIDEDRQPYLPISVVFSNNFGVFHCYAPQFAGVAGLTFYARDMAVFSYVFKNLSIFPCKNNAPEALFESVLFVKISCLINISF